MANPGQEQKFTIIKNLFMKRHVLFIHGAGEGAYKEDEKLAASLRHLLGSSYEVRYPEMEDEVNAPYPIWVSQIKKELANMENAILVGHSVGASVLIKFLCEDDLAKNISGVFLIATPFWGGNGGWTYDGYEQLELPKHKDTLQNKTPLFFYHSKDDEVVPFAHLALYAKRFPDATIRELDQGGHQLNNDLSRVAEDIRKHGS